MTEQHKPPPGWKKGQSGNPAGRPKGTGEVAKIRAAIAKQLPALLEALMTVTENSRSHLPHVPERVTVSVIPDSCPQLPTYASQ